MFPRPYSEDLQPHYSFFSLTRDGVLVHHHSSQERMQMRRKGFLGTEKSKSVVEHCCGMLKTKTYTISLPFILPTQHTQTEVGTNSPPFGRANSISAGGGEREAITNVVVLPQAPGHWNHYRITQGRAPWLSSI